MAYHKSIPTIWWAKGILLFPFHKKANRGIMGLFTRLRKLFTYKIKSLFSVRARWFAQDYMRAMSQSEIISISSSHFHFLSFTIQMDAFVFSTVLLCYTTLKYTESRDTELFWQGLQPRLWCVFLICKNLWRWKAKPSVRHWALTVP